MEPELRAPHPEPSLQHRGFLALAEAHAAAQKGDELAMKIALVKARCFISADELEALRLENNFSFVLQRPLQDPRRELISSSRSFKLGFADHR